MNDEFLSALGICRKAGKAIYGFETVKQAVKNGEVNIVFTARDLSKKTGKEIKFICDSFETECIEVEYSMEKLKQSIGRETGIVAVTDEGFAKMIKQKIRYQEGNL